LHVIPQKSRTFSKALRFSPFMQFYCELLRSPVNPLWKHFYLDSKGLCVAWHYPRIDGLNGLRPTLRVGTLHLNPRPLRALAPTASFRGPLCLLRFRPKNMPQHIFQLETELQNIPEAAPSSRSFSVSERLAQYGASGLSVIEHLALLVGRDSMAEALLRHFGW